MRIGELATRTGVSVRSLRYYEEQGLLASERSPSGQRRYEARAVDRVHRIQQLYRAGLPSRSIRELLPCVATGEASEELLIWLAGERDRIDRQIDDLKDTRNRLDDIISTATTALHTGQPCEVS
ncbi:MerR family transcriptional regulator [Streptomyces spectabilis]|uniref:MerR family transcriptional regulator n=1 Tax=Streptomyces spectabilis TaxID=68270 RepID=UPI0033FFC573